MHTTPGPSLTLFIKGNRPAVDHKLRKLQGDLLPPLHHLPLSKLVTHTRPRLSPAQEKEAPAGLEYTHTSGVLRPSPHLAHFKQQQTLNKTTGPQFYPKIISSSPQIQLFPNHPGVEVSP